MLLAFMWFLFGFLIHLILFAAGICIVMMKTPIYRNDYFMNNANDSTFFRCRIIQPPDQTDKNFKLYVTVDERLTDNKNVTTIGKSIIYVKSDSIHNLISPDPYSTT